MCNNTHFYLPHKSVKRTALCWRSVDAGGGRSKYPRYTKRLAGKSSSIGRVQRQVMAFYPPADEKETVLTYNNQGKCITTREVGKYLYLKSVGQ